VESFGNFVPAEEHYGDEGAFQEESHNALDGQRGPENIAYEVRIVRPVGAEFEFENDSRCYADREIDPENPHPELRRPFPKLVAGTVIDALHDRADDAETEGQRHEQPMVNGCHRKLRARPVDHLHPVGSR